MGEKHGFWFQSVSFRLISCVANIDEHSTNLSRLFHHTNCIAGPTRHIIAGISFLRVVGFRGGLRDYDSHFKSPARDTQESEIHSRIGDDGFFDVLEVYVLCIAWELTEVHGAVIGRYERDEVKPSIEVAKGLAEALEASLDYLVGSTDTLLDNAVVKKILDIQKLKPNDKHHVFALLDAFLKQTKIQCIM